MGTDSTAESELQTGQRRLEPEPAHRKWTMRCEKKNWLGVLVYVDTLFLCKKSSKGYFNHSFMYLVLMVWVIKQL